MYIISILLVVNIFFPLVAFTQWNHLSGSQSVGYASNYGAGWYPGGIRDHAMETIGEFIYVFGGYGNDSSLDGMGGNGLIFRMLK